MLLLKLINKRQFLIFKFIQDTKKYNKLHHFLFKIKRQLKNKSVQWTRLGIPPIRPTTFTHPIYYRKWKRGLAQSFIYDNIKRLRHGIHISWCTLNSAVWRGINARTDASKRPSQCNQSAYLHLVSGPTSLRQFTDNFVEWGLGFSNLIHFRWIG